MSVCWEDHLHISPPHVPNLQFIGAPPVVVRDNTFMCHIMVMRFTPDAKSIGKDESVQADSMYIVVE